MSTGRLKPAALRAQLLARADDACHKEAGFLMEVATEVALRRRQNVWLEGRLTDEDLRTPAWLARQNTFRRRTPRAAGQH